MIKIDYKWFNYDLLKLCEIVKNAGFSYEISNVSVNNSNKVYRMYNGNKELVSASIKYEWFVSLNEMVCKIVSMLTQKSLTASQISVVLDIPVKHITKFLKEGFFSD